MYDALSGAQTVRIESRRLSHSQLLPHSANTLPLWGILLRLKVSGTLSHKPAKNNRETSVKSFGGKQRL